MKPVTLTILVCLSVFLSSSAQFDDKFYFPSKEWNEASNLKFNEYNFYVEKDTVNAILLKPETAPKATILFYHGAAGNITTYTEMVKPLINASYQVFMPDFRGYGKSTGKPTHINIANDAQTIFNKIIEKEEFKNLPIIIYGASMDTQIATKIAKDNQEDVVGLVLDGTISSFTDMALLSVPEEQKTMITQYVTSPYSAKNDIKEIKNLPKLFIHSKEDKSVPFSQGMEVYENALHPKELWVFEGEHLESAIKYPEEFIQRINTLIIPDEEYQNDLSNNTLKITIEYLRNNKGKIILKIEDLSGNKVASASENITNNKCFISIDCIAPGRYSISYYHDENNNKKLDSRFGIPEEGYGFSNNAFGKYGPAPIEERAMTISGGETIILVPKYLNF